MDAAAVAKRAARAAKRAAVPELVLGAPAIPGLVVPRVGTVVPSAYADTRGSADVVQLARILLDLGIGTAADWRHADRSAAEFVRLALAAFVARSEGAQAARRFDLNASLRRSPSAWGWSVKAEDQEPGVFYLALEPETAGCGVFRPAIELLEPVHPRLPVTMYAAFAQAVNSVGRLYDYVEAAERIEMWQDGMDEADIQQRYDEGMATVRSVEEMIPAALKDRKPLAPAQLRALLAGAGADVRRIVEATLAVREAMGPRVYEVRRVGRKWVSDCCIPRNDEAYYCFDEGQRPIFVAVFDEDDAIGAMFDEEYLYDTGGEPQPAHLWRIDVRDPRTAAHAFGRLGAIARTAAAVSRLMDVLPANERFRVHRDPAPLPAQQGRPLVEVLGGLDRDAGNDERARGPRRQRIEVAA